MSDSEEQPKRPYEQIPFEDKVIDVNFTGKELNGLLRLLSFTGGAFEMAAQNAAQDPDLAKIYAENSAIAYAYRKRLLDYAKVGLPVDSSKH